MVGLIGPSVLFKRGSDRRHAPKNRPGSHSKLKLALCQNISTYGLIRDSIVLNYDC